MRPPRTKLSRHLMPRAAHLSPGYELLRPTLELSVITVSNGVITFKLCPFECCKCLQICLPSSFSLVEKLATNGMLQSIKPTLVSYTTSCALHLIIVIRTCLSQLLIILCNHIRSKTRLIMNLIATLGSFTPVCTTADCLEYQMSLLPHRACCYIQTGHGRGGRWGVVSQLQQQHALGLCSVLRWLPLIDSRNVGHLPVITC